MKAVTGLVYQSSFLFSNLCAQRKAIPSSVALQDLYDDLTRLRTAASAHEEVATLRGSRE